MIGTFIGLGICIAIVLGAWLVGWIIACALNYFQDDDGLDDF